MKARELIIQVTGGAVERSKLSIFHTESLKKMGFDVVEIGLEITGFNWTDLQAFKQYVQNQETINLLIDAHGSVKDYGDGSTYFSMQMDEYSGASGRVVLETIRNIIKEQAGDIEPQFNVVFSSCHGGAIHADLARWPTLREGSKVITISDADKVTVESDLMTNRMDALCRIAIENDIHFIDLVKLYCLTKRASENVPIAGKSCSDGYKTISFEQIAQDLGKKFPRQGGVQYSKFLEDVFAAGILNKDIMNKVIVQAQEVSKIEELKLPSTLGNRATCDIGTSREKDFIQELSDKYYSGQSLEFLSLSHLRDLSNNYDSACESRNKFVTEHPNLPQGVKIDQNTVDAYLESYTNYLANNEYFKMYQLLLATRNLTGIDPTPLESTPEGKEWIVCYYSITSQAHKALCDLKCLTLQEKLVQVAEDNIDKLIAHASSPFAFEPQIIKDTDNFASFTHDNILSNHGYLMVLGADNLDSYVDGL